MINFKHFSVFTENLLISKTKSHFVNTDVKFMPCCIKSPTHPSATVKKKAY